MKLAIIQPELLWEDKGGNFAILKRMMSSLPKGTDVVILPEMFTTGFTMDISYAERMQGETFDFMKEAAVIHDFAICGSYIVVDDGKYFNRFAFVSPETEYYYDKRHLFSMGEEDKFFTPGNSRLVFSFRNVRISPYVCYDLRFPVWSRNRNEYDLAIYVSSWPGVRISAWNALLRARAIENQCYIAGSNRVGTDGNGVFHNGMSQIINPRGEVISVAEAEKQCVISSDISIPELADFRNKFNVLRDADDYEIIN
jgi:predicted amidohydrolase